MAEEVSIVFNDSGYVPFFSAGEENSDGEYQGEGMFIDFLDAFENAHPEHTIRRIRLPRPRANMMMSTGEVDGYALMSPVFMDKKGGLFSFSEKIWTTMDTVFVRADSAVCYSSIEDLRGVTLGVISGYGYGFLDEPLANGTIREYRVSRHELLYKMLLHERLDAIVDNIHVLPYKVERMGIDINEFRACRPVLYSFDLSMYVRTEKKDFLNDFNAFVKSSKKNGFLLSLEKKWVGEGFF